MFHGKTRCKWQFSAAMLNYQRVRSFDPFVGKVMCKQARSTQEAWPGSSVVTCAAKHLRCLPMACNLWQGIHSISCHISTIRRGHSLHFFRFFQAIHHYVWVGSFCGDQCYFAVLRLPDQIKIVFWLEDIQGLQLVASFNPYQII